MSTPEDTEAIEPEAGPPAVQPEAGAASVPTQPAPVIDPRTGQPAAPLWE